MKRRKARENAFLVLFEYSFGNPIDEIVEFCKSEAPDYSVDTFGQGLLEQYQQHAEQVDSLIQSKLKGWSSGRIPRVSLAILRLSVTEMLFGEPDMDSVVINEAVELAKSFGGEGDYQFINGVLGNISRSKTSLEPQENAGETV